LEISPHNVLHLAHTNASPDRISSALQYEGMESEFSERRPSENLRTQLNINDYAPRLEGKFHQENRLK
jgi:hypothetical protein